MAKTDVVEEAEPTQDEAAPARAPQGFDPMSPMLMAVEIAERVMLERALRMQLRDALAETARLREENGELRDTIEGFGRTRKGGNDGTDEG